MTTLYSHVLEYTTTEIYDGVGGKSKYFICAPNIEKAREIADSFISKLNQDWDGLVEAGIVREVTKEDFAQFENRAEVIDPQIITQENFPGNLVELDR